MWQDKNRKKKYLREENCWEDLWQENYLGGQIRGMTKNIGEDQRGIGGDGKEEEEDKPQRQSKRKKKSSKKIQG